MRKGTCVIVNPVAGSYVGGALLRAHADARPRTVLRETAARGHARELAEEARAEGFARIVVAGGDGTVNEVVSSLAPDPDGVVLGIIPLGTGNDLARTLCVPLDVAGALEVLDVGEARRIDVFRMTLEGDPPRYGINASVGGVAGQLTGELEQEAKRLWGVLAYVESGLRALGKVAPHALTFTWDDDTTEVVQAVAVVVANGRTCGGGQAAAPHANPEDGLLQVVVVRHGTAVELAGAVARLVAADLSESPLVMTRATTRVRIASDPPMPFNIDGEPVGAGPAEWEVLPGRLQVLVGPGYRPGVDVCA